MYQIRVEIVLLARAVFFCFSFVFQVYVVLCLIVLVVSTSAIDCLERLVSEMSYYVSSGTLNPTHSLTHSYQCAYDCVQLCYTIQHRTVPIIFPLILQTIITAQMADGAEGNLAVRMKREKLQFSC